MSSDRYLFSLTVTAVFTVLVKFGSCDSDWTRMITGSDGETPARDETCYAYLDRMANSHCSKEKKFVIQNPAVNWHKAKYLCEKVGYKLASITSEKENENLLKQCKLQGLTDPTIWVGANDLANEGNFTWASNVRTPVAYTNWIQGDPNNYNGDEDCVLFGKAGWYDDDCLADWNYACEYFLHEE